MKVFLFETTNATPHLETSFELAKMHLDKGDTVSYYFLGHSVPFAEFVHKKLPLFNCSSPERIGAKLVGSNLKYIEPNLTSISLERIVNQNFNNAEELRSFKYKNYKAGLSTLSSLISETRFSNPDTNKHRKLIYKILISGIKIYEYVISEIDKEKPDLIYLFNGRFAVNRAILDAALEKNIAFKVHERGANKHRYTSDAWLQHDFNSVREDFLLKWNSCSESNRVQTANLFFQERRKGYQQSWLSFTNRQDKNHLPSLPAGKRVVAYFSSSDDEYAAVEDLVIWDRWPNQLTAVKELIELISKNTDLFLVIRLHPHKAEKSLTDLKEWLTLPFAENVLLIPPNDPVDTYALIERADVVVTSGSTVGIESVFWGTPSICLGPSLYSHLDAVY